MRDYKNYGGDMQSRMLQTFETYEQLDYREKENQTETDLHRDGNLKLFKPFGCP